MRVTLVQADPKVGDIEGNVEKLRRTIETIPRQSTDLVIFSELFLTGYPPMDLLEKNWFMAAVNRGLDEIKALSSSRDDLGILLGCPFPTGSMVGKKLFNSAVLFEKGNILVHAGKSLLPTYDVFDEARYFSPFPEVATLSFRGETLGISICEDAWNDPLFWPNGEMYERDPVQELADNGATLMINLSASPFSVGKIQARYDLLRGHVRRNGIPFVYVNQVGGNDELVFDGTSMVLDDKGDLLALLPSFEEGLVTVDIRSSGSAKVFPVINEIRNVYHALVLGIKDYLSKCGFSKVVVGLSGGIDSALTCALAVQALGPDNVLGISMPSPYSSSGSVEDSRTLSKNLGMQFKVIPITDIFNSMLVTLDRDLEGPGRALARENIQARIRGNILMAISNASGSLVLSTGNKSEMSVGYCTLYGDMSGGLSVLADVPKTMVYDLARFINSSSETIPVEIIEKVPSAELRPDQKDSDTLPPYPVLDEIIHLYIEENCSLSQIVEKGFEKDTVLWVVKAISRSEYKRKQAAPGLKVTSKAFGIGRRIPIAARTVE